MLFIGKPMERSMMISRHLTNNFTSYYQLTNYYVDKTKLLFLHRGTTLWYITLHSSTLHLVLKLLLSYYQTTILETERTIGSYTTKKVLLSRDSPCFFPAFLFFVKPFSLNSLEQRDTDSLFATISLWYSLFGVGMLRVWNGCVYNLWNVTQESYSVRVQVLGNHCSQGVFCR